MKRTLLYELHRQRGARMSGFAGWEMPIQYAGILHEHEAVRQKAGLFDLCHMTRIEIEGPGALQAVQKVVTNDIATLQPGSVRYSLVCNEAGGIVDDALVYFRGDRYLVVGNAANHDVDLELFSGREGKTARVRDVTGAMAMIALQGPCSQDILGKMTAADLPGIRYYCFSRGEVLGVVCLISRTGYTGEDGFELYFDQSGAADMWSGLLAAGEDHGLEPAGLGARDTLRLEAALPLYGHELDTGINPYEAGLGKFVKLEKGPFTGREALKETAAGSLPRKLAGIQILGKAIPRQGYAITAEGRKIGVVTSGTFSPTLKKPIDLGYVEASAAQESKGCEVEIRGKGVSARVVGTPFYRRER